MKPRPLYPRERTPVPCACEARWDPEPGWMYWRREKSLATNEFQILDLPGSGLVAKPLALTTQPTLIAGTCEESFHYALNKEIILVSF